MTKQLGLVILAVVIGIVVVFQFLGKPGAQPAGPGARPSGGGAAVTVRGAIGGEKEGFLRDPEVQRILRDRFGVTVDYTRAGSIDIVRGDNAGRDFLWPGSQIALEIYKDAGGKYTRGGNVASPKAPLGGGLSYYDRGTPHRPAGAADGRPGGRQPPHAPDALATATAGAARVSRAGVTS